MNNPGRLQTLAALGGFAAGVLGVCFTEARHRVEAPAPRSVFRDAPHATAFEPLPEARWIVRRPAMETLLAQAEAPAIRAQEPPPPPVGAQPRRESDGPARFSDPEEEVPPDPVAAPQPRRVDPVFASAGPAAFAVQPIAAAAAIARPAPAAAVAAPEDPPLARSSVGTSRIVRAAPRAAALQALAVPPGQLQRFRGLPTFAELVKSFEEDSRALGPLPLAGAPLPIGVAPGAGFAVGGTGMVIPGTTPAPPAGPTKGAGGSGPSAPPPPTLKPVAPLSSIPLAPTTPAAPPAPIPWRAEAQQQGLLFPDISVWNNVKDWDALAKASHGIIVMKVRQTHVDKLFNESLAEAEKRKMIVIGYAFGYGADGGQQADAFVLNFPLKPGRIMMLDLERNTFGPTMNDSQAVAFVQRVYARTGKYPMLYTSASRPRPGALARCPRYVAKWSSGPPDDAAIWQYTNGQIGPTPHTYPGIGHCDINRLMITYAKLRQLAGLDHK